MILSRTLLPALLAVLSFSFTVQAEPASDALIGTWYSEKQQEGETIKWLTRRMQDQRYAALFLVCDGENFSWVQKETGVWRVEDGKLVQTASTIENMHGKKPAEKITTYTNLSLKGGTLTYHKMNSDKSFSFQHVADGFQISCENH
jgi:uncharacterized protein (DUF2249 family)